ncbi:tellurite resistance TerB family protein [Leptolyngbya sp. NIES-2104]|uniref:tellurite resistance TerB family protein n=1 Tax=Leptolyngbya sp. NIES-2104 TaxID=1552121 RepID=UPI0006ECB7F1|nr:TerB family tellurite resistance protein [Leptolyngbya sp. NIES-2104]GAP95650.1 hypothetical protein NIES2104_21740 [Leptolyngbya sp. NIES-2104]
MPAIISLILPVILPSVSAIFSAIVPFAMMALGSLLGFAVSRVGQLPKYIKILILLYQDSAPDSQTRKYLTTALLILGSILTFMAHSFIPFTGVPFIGMVTAPIALLVAIVVALATLDLVSNLNEDHVRNFKTIHANGDFQSMQDDMLTLKVDMGDSWVDLTRKIQTVFEKAMPQIEALGQELAKDGRDLSQEINKCFSYQLVELAVYFNGETGSKITLGESEIAAVRESLEPWQKVGTSLFAGSVAGIGSGMIASNAATAAFMPAAWWTPVATQLPGALRAAIGMKTVVGASSYGLLTVGAPIALGLAIGAGTFGVTMYAFNQMEARNLSSFLADVILASLPMVKADGVFDEEEKTAINQLLANPQIQDHDRQRVRAVMSNISTFEDVIHQNLLSEKNSDKADIKRKLLLSLTWEIAKADGKIAESEQLLHDRMAKILQVDSQTVHEIRRLIAPKILAASTNSPVQVEANLQKESAVAG